MSAESQRLLLYGVFQALRAAGAPLGIPDYLAGIRALELVEPFAGSPSVRRPDEDDLPAPAAQRAPRRVRERGELVWLCQVLWARSDHERRVVERFITASIEMPPAKVVKDFRARLDPGSPAGEDDPPPVAPALERVAPLSTEESEDHAASSDSVAEDPSAGERRPEIPVSFHPSDSKDGDMTLPALPPGFERPAESFILDTGSVVSLRGMATIWRRYYIPSRRTSSREIDVPATVGEMSKSGKLLRPVLRVRRTNTAALLVLVDAGEGMAPWHSLEPVLTGSLVPALSRLRESSLYYFKGAPGRHLYKRRELVDASPLEEVLDENRGRPVLIFSEADAARGTFDQSKAERIASFFNQARQSGARPVVWINPMPPSRWSRTTTEVIRLFPDVHLLPLGTGPLMLAVDIMRGAKS